jgi:hypothetical protein
MRRTTVLVASALAALLAAALAFPVDAAAPRWRVTAAALSYHCLGGPCYRDAVIGELKLLGIRFLPTSGRKGDAWRRARDNRRRALHEPRRVQLSATGRTWTMNLVEHTSTVTSGMLRYTARSPGDELAEPTTSGPIRGVVTVRTRARTYRIPVPVKIVVRRS